MADVGSAARMRVRPSLRSDDCSVLCKITSPSMRSTLSNANRHRSSPRMMRARWALLPSRARRGWVELSRTTW